MSTGIFSLFQVCLSGHQLEFFFVKPKSLEYCSGCLHVMREQGFRCVDDNYYLCDDCVRNNPPDFIGTAVQKLRGQFNKEEECQGDLDEWSEDESYDYDAPFEGYGLQGEKEDD